MLSRARADYKELKTKMNNLRLILHGRVATEEEILSLSKMETWADRAKLVNEVHSLLHRADTIYLMKNQGGRAPCHRHSGIDWWVTKKEPGGALERVRKENQSEKSWRGRVFSAIKKAMPAISSAHVVRGDVRGLVAELTTLRHNNKKPPSLKEKGKNRK